MSECNSESSTSPKPSKETKTTSGFSMSIQSNKTKILGNKSVLKKRRITDDQEEETEQQTIEYITVFEDKTSKSPNLKKNQIQSKKTKKGTNEKDNKESVAPEYLTNNSGLSFGLNIMKKPTNNQKEKRESILAKVRDFKNSQKKEQLSDNEDSKILSNEKPEPEKSLKEQALEELLREPKKEETVDDEEQINRKTSFNMLSDDMMRDKPHSRKRGHSPSSE
ncbi:hypothetical protein RclHR1_10360002 [Rhizophagus clarus]|uniref:Uncharacterized protein n=1 Tax=Rhizophagus clarus TaxID=94130 RepID=A0A2Z6Q1K9_9GLOM|nr:hypothetical protein RclHR1_10360002 [Rhizophagus clarus]GES78066.1 hypothetical protein GLOIN_2v1647572 [Rhizophagus clarus]